MTIPKDRITRIVRIPGRSLTVYGHGRQQFIEIPESLAGFATVESTLRGWHSFEERPAALAAWFPMSAGLGTIALYAVALLATNRVLATAAGVFLIAMLASSEVALWRNRHADPRMRRLSWLLPPCILVVAVQVWLAWAR
ncbi:MAG TPA: hypothetical protein VMW75_06260 [Thermoanaerobaculia bacterium]|nr:hypothetical protein [Thermoanaerobaculia bacterium]